MVKVYAPNKHYTGISANVVFRNGVGETSDPHLLDWFKSKGYTVEAPKPPAKRKQAQAKEPIKEPIKEQGQDLFSEPEQEPEQQLEPIEEPAAEEPKKSQGGKPKGKRK